MTEQEKLIRRTETYGQLMKRPDLERDMMAKFNDLVKAYKGATDMSVVTKNKETFKVIMSDMMFNLLFYIKSRGRLDEYIKTYPDIALLIDSSNNLFFTNIKNRLKAKGLTINEEPTIQDIERALSMYNIEEADSIEGAEKVSGESTGEVPPVDFEDDKLEAELADQYGGAALSEDELRQQAIDVEDAIAEAELIREQLDKLGSVRLPDNNDELEQAIHERDNKIKEAIAKAKKDRENKEIDDAAENTIDPAIVRKTLSAIMAVYDVIYQPLFENSPLGILTKEGIVSVKSDLSLNIVAEGRDYARKLYAATINGKYKEYINELDYHEEVSASKCISSTGDLICNYIPNWHIRNIYGIYRDENGILQKEKKWKKFRTILVKKLTKSITNLLERYNGDRPALSIKIVELFTTVFIMEEFDVNKAVKATLKSIAISKAFENCSGFGDVIAEGAALSIDKSTIKVIDNSEIGNGIQSTLIVFDEKTYNGEMLFAYKPLQKILESGSQVGLQKLLLGRDVQGRNVTVNFQSPQMIDTLIIAGSGSGKGVVTLNMLATFIASGCPTVYVDYKPDMAAMLWNLERETGAKILAIDGLAGETEGIKPVRDYGIGINKPDIKYKDQLNVIPYLKAFQCMVLCALARNTEKCGLSSKQQKMMFIFDEAQKMNSKFMALRESVETYLKEEKSANKKEKTPEYEYSERLKNMLSDLGDGASEVRDTTGRTSNTGFLILGQHAEVSVWSKGSSLKKEPFGFLVGSCSMKLIGREAVNDLKYSLNGATPKGRDLTNERGYFALVDVPVADKSMSDKIKIVKTYLALNANDYEDDGNGGSTGKFTGGMLKNVTDQTLRDQLIYEDFYPEDENGERYVNPKVGFKGLVEYMGSTIPGFDLKKNLSFGYECVDAVLSAIGITGPNGQYECIEEYLFDCSINALFSIGELKDLILNGGTIAEFNEDLPGNSSGGGFSGGVPDEDFSSSSTGESVSSNESKQTPPVKEPPKPPQQLPQQTSQPDYSSLPKNIREQLSNNQPPQPPPPPQPSQEDLARINQEAQQAATTAVAQAQQQGLSDEEIRRIAQQVYLNTRAQQIAEETARAMQQQQQWQQQQWQQQSQQQQQPPNERQQVAEISQQELREMIERDSSPYVTGSDEVSNFKMGGANNRDIFVTPGPTAAVFGLTKENSIIAKMEDYDTAEKFGRSLFKTLGGAKYEFNRRWKVILDSVAREIKPGLVTRLLLTEDALAFNNKQIATLGVLNGFEDVRIVDIVNFNMTASRFKNITEIQMDSVIFEKAYIELNDPILSLFKIFPSLQTLLILKPGTNEAAEPPYTRRGIMSGQERQRMDNQHAEVQFRSQMEVMAAAKNKNLRTRSPGYQNQIWEASKRFQGQGWGAARDAIMAENPKLFKAAGMSILTLGVLGVGAIFGLGGRIASMIRR